MEKQPGLVFENRIASILQKANIPFEREVGLAGLNPDFLVRSPNGHLIILETKATTLTQGSQIRAIQQAHYYNCLLM